MGYVLKSVLQKPLVYDINDPWTQWAMGVWPTPLHFALERRMESRVLAKADGISMRGDTYRAELLQAHPELDPAKVVVFPNGYDSAACRRARSCSAAGSPTACSASSTPENSTTRGAAWTGRS